MYVCLWKVMFGFRARGEVHEIGGLRVAGGRGRLVLHHCEASASRTIHRSWLNSTCITTRTFRSGRADKTNTDEIVKGKSRWEIPLGPLQVRSLRQISAGCSPSKAQGRHGHAQTSRPLHLVLFRSLSINICSSIPKANTTLDALCKHEILLLLERRPRHLFSRKSLLTMQPDISPWSPPSLRIFTATVASSVHRTAHGWLSGWWKIQGHSCRCYIISSTVLH